MPQPATAVAHLSPERWAIANRLHLTKVISEFVHESIVEPVLQYEEGDWAQYLLSPPEKKEIEYLFRAQKLQLNHWYIDKASLRKLWKGEESDLDSLSFMLEFQEQLGISKELLPSYLEEITSTLYGSAYMLSAGGPTSKELVSADYQTIEHAMTSGHPSFVANNGRIGFDTEDYRQYTPEADQAVRLLWLAGHKSRASFNAIESIPYHTLLEQELGEETTAAFRLELVKKGLDPSDYYFIPVHPWQWYNKLAITFAPDIANQLLVFLGTGPDSFFVQQSLRTLYNVSHPQKFYTKTALSILNMGFVRGMSPYFMDTTPPITTWIKNTIGQDTYMKKWGFTMLCEVATVGYRHLYYEQFGNSSHYNKMLAALWRESPASVTEPSQQLMTMAALLHVDREGNALLPELVKASGKSVFEWLKHYLDCYLKPLLHGFYQYDLTFMPHGENVILVLENHVPVKIIMKDITEEVVVFRSDIPLPERAKRICIEAPDEIRILNILVDIFDGYFRFLTQVLVEHCQFSDNAFWKLVASCVQEYQAGNPHLQEKFERFDLFTEEFMRSCLNRLQLRNNKQMLNTADPLAIINLQYVGTLKNPLAKHVPSYLLYHEEMDKVVPES